MRRGLLALALLASAGSALAAPAGDPKRGAEIYERCGACHSLQVNRTGPKHCGLIGRKAGTAPEFDYSDAMKKSGIVWGAQSLDGFLKSPFTRVPGTAMGFAGIEDDQERADVIAYLVYANKTKALCP
ncbi:MAG: c-type cytochrome [Alphaproteobacteria bacterium]